MIKRNYLLIIALTFLLINCKKEENKNFILKGTVRDARSGAPLGNASVLAEQQLLEGGSFGGFFSEAASGNTSGSGNYELQWDNANIVEARVTGSAVGYIARVYNLRAASFEPGKEISQNIDLHPEANIAVRVLKSGVVPNASQLNFRFENAEFDCLCCNNTWRNINSNAADSTFQCRVYGDTWLRYRYEVLNSGDAVFMRDSIYCGRNTLSNLTIEW
jgi:hypothetical protein